jgi:uncharacterized RDD family membrane protein YckC
MKEDNDTPEYFEERDVFGNVVPKPDLNQILKDQAEELPLLEVQFAGLGKRLMAFLIDCAILIAPVYFANYIFLRVINSSASDFSKMLTLDFLIWGFYYAFTESSSKQATFGKQICKLKVITYKNGTLTFIQGFWHFAFQFISILPLGFGIWSIIYDKKKQAWHDMMVGCYVIENIPGENAL